jgi:hypothetical protein
MEDPDSDADPRDPKTYESYEPEQYRVKKGITVKLNLLEIL